MLRRSALIFVLVVLWPMGILGSAALAAGSSASPGGLVLPPGNAPVGRLVFVRMQCNHCHMITGDLSDGIRLPVTSTPAPLLDADVARKSQAELVTSILNPSHVIEPSAADRGEGKLSPMGDYTHALTVRELIDLVAFIQSAAGPKTSKNAY